MLLRRLYTFASIFSIAITVAGTSGLAQTKRAYLIGGSGQLQDETVDYAHRFKNFGDGLVARGWQKPTILFEAPTQEFTSELVTKVNMQKAFDHACANANGDDTVLFYFDTDGKIGDIDRSGKVVGLPAISSNGGEALSLSNIESTLECLKEKNVKTGLVLNTCFSGAALSLAKKYPNLCVVTSSSPRYPSTTYSSKFDLTSFDNNFANLTAYPQNISLEDLFRLARKNSLSTDLPMISSLPTPGQDLFDDFLFGYDPKGYYRDQNLNKPNQGCPRCATSDIATPARKYIDDVLAVAEGSIRANLAPQRAALLGELTPYFEKYKAVQADVIKINPVLSKAVIWPFNDPILDRYKKFNVGELKGLVATIKNFKDGDINKISWINPIAKSSLLELRSKLPALESALEPYLAPIRSDLAQYDIHKKALFDAGAFLFGKERIYYEEFQRLNSQRLSSSCNDIHL